MIKSTVVIDKRMNYGLQEHTEFLKLSPLPSPVWFMHTADTGHEPLAHILREYTAIYIPHILYQMVETNGYSVLQ